MLRVDRNDFSATGACRLGHESAGHDQGLLVGQGDALAGTKRRKGGVEPGRTHHGIDHDIRIGVGRGLYQHLGATRPARIIRRARQPGVARLPLLHLGGEVVPIPPGGQGDQLEMLLVPAEHVQRAAADRAGGPQHGDPPQTLLCLGRALPDRLGAG